MQLVIKTFDAHLADSGDKARLYHHLTILLLAMIAAATVAGIVVPAGIGWDFANFYDTGRRAAAWQIADLYNAESLIAGQQPQGKLAFWGAPISALFYAPLGWFSAESALMVFKIQNALALFAALWLLYRHCRQFVEQSKTAQWRFAAMFAGLVLIYQPFWSIYRVGGQTTPTVFLLFTIALLSHTKKQFRVSAACIALALLIKPGFAFVLLPLVLVCGRKFLQELAFTLIAVGLVSILLLGWEVHAQFLQTMLQGMKNAYPWLYNSSLYVTAENLKLLAEPPVDARWLGIPVAMVKLAMVALFGWLYWQSRKQDWPTAARRHFDFLMAVTFCLMISQTVWEHYLEVLFLLLAYLAAVHRQLSFGAQILLAAIFVVSLGQNIVLTNALGARFGFTSIPALVVVGLLKSSPLWLTLILLLRHRQEFFQSYLSPQWQQLTVRR